MDDDYKAASVVSGGKTRRRVKRRTAPKRKRTKTYRRATRRTQKKFA